MIMNIPAHSIIQIPCPVGVPDSVFKQIVKTAKARYPCIHNFYYSGKRVVRMPNTREGFKAVLFFLSKLQTLFSMELITTVPFVDLPGWMVDVPPDADPDSYLAQIEPLIHQPTSTESR
jgi:hypothetical protein